MIAGNHTGRVLPHIAADRTRPRLLCSHGLLAAGAGRTEDDELFSFKAAAEVVSRPARGREVTVTGCPRVWKSSAAPSAAESPPKPMSGPSRAPRWHRARLPTAALRDPGVPAPLTSAAAGALSGVPAACTGQGRGNRAILRGQALRCCEQPQARPGTAQPKPCSTSKPRRAAQHGPGTSQTEPGSAGTPL